MYMYISKINDVQFEIKVLLTLLARNKSEVKIINESYKTIVINSLVEKKSELDKLLNDKNYNEILN